jgi:hypothetical protein
MIENQGAEGTGNVHFIADVVHRDSGVCISTLRTSIKKDQ